MCGIAGILRFDRRPIAAELSAMARSLAHRGPDQENIWTTDHPAHGVGLAHRRLSIRDLSEAGRQPMASHSGRLMLTYNGELYNDGDLMRVLAAEHGVSFRTSCDTEVLIELISRRGLEAIKALNGIFAFGLYDLDRAELVLVRDPIGVKPLYLWRDPGRRAIAFASEVKAFLALPEFSRKISPDALIALLTQGYVGPGRSLMQDVVSLEPGEVLRIASDGRVSELFRLRAARPSAENVSPATAREAASLLRPAFEEAVARQRVSDVPLAVWQSGGVDSSLINAACGQPRPQALSVTSSDAAFDELGDARKVADHLGSTIVPVQLEEEAEGPAQAFQSLVWHLDGELADSSALAVKRLSVATRLHATVVLAGDGADEVFGGYATYAATKMAAGFGGGVPRSLSRGLARWCFAAAAAADGRYPKLEWAGRFLQGLPEGLYSHAEWRRYGMPWTLRQLVADDEFCERKGLLDYRSTIDAAQAASPGGTARQWAQSADMSHYLPGDMLMKVDRMSMAHGLEVRVPFLDLQFLQQAMALPPNLRLPHRGRTKPILRDMLKSFGFADYLVDRRKTGFNVPLASQLRGTYRMVMTELLLDEDYVSPYLCHPYVRVLCSDHLERRANNAFVLWALMTFAQWRKHLGH